MDWLLVGSRTTKVVPASDVDVTVNDPECASTTFLTMNKPIPRWLGSWRIFVFFPQGWRELEDCRKGRLSYGSPSLCTRKMT